MKKRITACILSVFLALSFQVPALAAGLPDGSKEAPAAVKMAADTETELPEPVLARAEALSAEQIILEWDPVEQAEGYYIYRRSGNKEDYTCIDFVVGQETASYLDTSVSSGVRYTYTVQAYAKKGDTVSSYSSEGLTVVSCYPGKVALDSAIATDGKIRITWKAVKNADGYYIYQKKSASGRWTLIGEKKGGDSVSYSGTAPAKPSAYFYTVRAYRAVGEKIYAGGYDKTGVAGITHVAVPRTVIKGAARSGQKIKVTWKPVSGVTGYQIYRKTKSSDWKKLAVVKGAKKTAYTDSKAKKNICYYYKVRAYTTLGGEDYTGAFSGTKNASIGDTPQLKAKENVYLGGTVQLAVKKNKKKVAWKSQNKTIATVSSKGVVTGKKQGTTQISAVIDGVQYDCKVTVKPAMTTSSPLKITARYGKAKTIPVTFRLSGKLSYKLSSKKVVSVSFGRWKGDKISVYVKPITKKGKVTLTLTNNKNREKLVFQITVK